MKKAMKQLFQKGISGILCAAMVLTSLSIPELTAYAAQPGIEDEVEAAALTNEETNEDINEVILEDDENIVEENTNEPDNGNTGSDEEKKGNDDTDGGSALKASLSADVTEEAEPSNDDDTVTVTLNYYYGDSVDEDDELGLYFWDDTSSSTAERTDTRENESDKWAIWGDKITYALSPVEGYTGWYSIALELAAEGDGRGFEIHKRVGDSTEELFKCDPEYDNNSDIYAKLISGDANQYAVKGYKTESDGETDTTYKLYAGDMVTSIMRNVTFYVYSSTDTPVIMAGNDTLSKVDEETGELSTLVDSEYDDGYDNHYYSMIQDKEQSNWYYLTFTAPDVAESAKMFALYSKLDSAAWAKDLVNGATENDWEVDFTPVFAGSIYYKDGVLSATRSVSLGQLKDLITEAKKIEQGNYTNDSWNALQAAIEAAETAVASLTGKADSYTDDDSETEDDTTITDAYDDLEEAIDNLQKEVVNLPITFYYYDDSIAEDDELGLVFWGGDTSSSTAERTDERTEESDRWVIWNGPTYALSPVEGYTGWYSIPLELATTGDGRGFEIFKKSSDSNSLFKCAPGDTNSDIYDMLVSGDADQYAVKGGKCYAGDMVTSIMRNVTFYVYSSTDTPVIMVEKGTLSKVDEETGELSTLDDSGYDDEYDNNNHYYSMIQDEEQSNWYYLTFTAPDVAASAKMFALYSKLDKEAWAKDFVNGTPEGNWQVDFTPVFAGSIYYKDGVLSATRSVSLGQLKDLITEAKKIEQGNYTDESWNALQAAIEAAETAVASLTGKDDSYTDDDSETEDDTTITDAYDDLEEAIDNLQKEEVNLPITFYYYDDSIAEDDELGLVFWRGDTSSANAERTDERTEESDRWVIWNGPTYALSPVEGYTGWYSIPLELATTGDGRGFEIFKKSSTSKSLFACAPYESDDNNPDIYAQLVSDTADKYAVKGSNCYAGDMVTSIMRNVTFYVYSSTDTPVIMAGNDTLSKVDEETGELSTLVDSGYDDGYDNHYYSMIQDKEQSNWYYLTFTAPDVEESAKMFALYSKLDSAAWAKDLVNGATENDWEVDFTPVFAGSIYYKDGILSATRSVSLGQLKGLIAEAKTIEQGNYTNDSWNALQVAIEAAETAVASLTGKADSYTDDDSETEGDTTIATAYEKLSAAIDGLSMEDVGIKLYYYIATNVEAVGLANWTNGKQVMEVNADTTTNWHAFGGSQTTYLFTKEDYPGWYSIELAFKNGGEEDAGFTIHTWDGSTTTQVYDCSYEWQNTDIYAALISGNEDKYAIKGHLFEGEALIKALMRNAKLYVYDSKGTPAIGADGELSYVDESAAELKKLSPSEQSGEIYYYDMEPTSDDGWYSITFSAPETSENSKKIGSLYSKADSSYTLAMTFVEGETSEEGELDYTPVFSGNVYYKNGKFYPYMPMTTDSLQALIDKADALIASEETVPKYEKEDGEGKEKWDDFIAKLDAAKAVVAKAEPTDEEIITAYDELDSAMKGLIPITIVSKNISVERVAIDDDFITGADISSYISLRESGVVFKDEDGNALSDVEFFKLLYDGGTNWIRIRVWNDPYNSNGNGYGGGNNDLEKAKIMGKLASQATEGKMKVLIDFHYSDFWADPAKQETPKAWVNLSLDEKVAAVEEYTRESLNELADAGVNVGMVQVGNETNNAICGENKWENMVRIFNAGSKGVRTSKFGEDCLVAVHIADPSDGKFITLANNLTNDVDYDVFAASYYPFWHGSITNLTNQLTTIASTCHKKVMVAETSWVTTWEDGDGHGNTAPKKEGQTLQYPVSLQGQANEIREVVNAVNQVNVNIESGNPAIGVFYWEPAWISPYYVYNADGSIDQSLYKKNQDAWEKYGSGWASSYSAEYDPVDAGLWYGGSAVDNQAWFDFDGTALETTKIYKYIRTSATAAERVNAISTVDKEIILKVNVGDDINLPNTIKVTFNDGSTSEDENNPLVKNISVKWDEDQQKLLSTDKPATFTISGIATCTYFTGKEDETKTEVFNDIALILEVVPNSNILENPGFETGSGTNADYWSTKLIIDTGETTVRANSEDVKSGSRGMHFYNVNPMHFKVKQTISSEKLEEGIYSFGGYIQGGGAGSNDLQTLYVEIYDSSDAETPKMTYKKTCGLNGYLNWVNPEIKGIKISDPENEYMVVGMEIETSEGGAWGTIDDMYLYGSYGINVNAAENGTVNVSSMEATSGDIVRIAAVPKNGYILSSISVSGAQVKNETIKLNGAGGTYKYVPAGDESPNKAVLDYHTEDGNTTITDETITASFKMPDGTVTIDAEFAPIDFSGASLEQVTVTGFTKGEDGTYTTDEVQEYTGKAIELDLEMKYKGYKLTSADYTAKYTNNKNKSTETSKALITVTAKGRKFTGSIKLQFSIDETKVDISKGVKAELNGASANTNIATYYYTGEEIEPTIKQLLNGSGPLKAKDGTALTEDDYNIYYENNIKVGTAKMIVIANSSSKKIKGSFTQTFKIAKCPIDNSNITISTPSGGVYSGGKITPNVTVKYGNKVLQKGKDYTLTYKNNVNVSIGQQTKPSIKVTGKGNYTGSTETYPGSSNKISFEISPKSISDHGVKIIIEDIIQDKAPKIVVKNGTKALTANKQYKVTEIVRIKDENNNQLDEEETIYQDGGTAKLNAKISKAGTYKVTVEGVNNYNGTVSETFRVIDKDHMMSNMKVTLPKSVVFTGSEIKLTTSGSDAQLVVTPKNSTQALDPTTDYEVKYEDDNGNKTNIKVGTAKIKIIGKGAYAGSKTASFKITKSSLVKASASVPDGKTGIEWTTKKDTILNDIEKTLGENDELYLPYTGYAWTPELNLLTSNGKLLVNGVDYTITYKNNLKPDAYASIIIKGKGNYSGSVSFDKVFKVKDTTLNDFVITIDQVEYTGKAIKPALTFVYKETGTEIAVKSGTAYAAKYKYNKDVASIESKIKPTITITEKGMNASKKGAAKTTLDIPFTITTARIKYTSVSDVKVQTYNGKAVKPKLAIKVNGKSLKEGTDYVVTYTGNSRPNDKATARIIGIGNYSGTVTKEFVIK